MKTVESDYLVLIDTEKFFIYVDSEDLAHRESGIIKDAYHRDWFFVYEGSEYFIPPAVFITNGSIKFINGRHRTLLLAKYLKKFPVLITHIDKRDIEKNLRALNEIALRPLEEHSVFTDMPKLRFGDFPIGY